MFLLEFLLHKCGHASCDSLLGSLRTRSFQWRCDSCVKVEELRAIFNFDSITLNFFVSFRDERLLRCELFDLLRLVKLSYRIIADSGVIGRPDLVQFRCRARSLHVLPIFLNVISSHRCVSITRIQQALKKGIELGMLLLNHVNQPLMHILEALLLLLDPHHSLFVRMKHNVLNHLEAGGELLLEERLLLVELGLQLHDE